MDSNIIINGKLVMPDEVIEEGTVVVQGSIIKHCGNRKDIQKTENTQVIDVRENYIVPGFVDIHCHGGGGWRCNDNPEAFANAHLVHGTTSVLATIAYNLSKKETLQGLEKVIRFMENKPSNIEGIHLEGPYINPKYGADSANARKPDPEEYNKIIQMAGKYIKLWTCAPEVEGADQFIDTVCSTGITLSVGHSELEACKLLDLPQRGFKVACHCTNATGVTPHPSRYEGTKEVGLDQAVMLCDDIYAEVIPDSAGVHVRPLMLKLLYKVKGMDRIIIVTDATDDSGMEKFRYIDVNGKEIVENMNDLNINEQGELSGSKLTMDYAVRNMMHHTGISIVEAFKIASLNPARAIGIENKVGSIEKGKLANLLIIDKDINIKKVMFEGQLIS
ncbi:MAG: N-acetylglucosamine-6-phosphate deacetylase [Clostridia bacterium]|nr:N-acetylglucosamine-6-phosphate deacetylase [Clostridia bacterium]